MVLLSSSCVSCSQAGRRQQVVARQADALAEQLLSTPQVANDPMLRSSLELKGNGKGTRRAKEVLENIVSTMGEVPGIQQLVAYNPESNGVGSVADLFRQPKGEMQNSLNMINAFRAQAARLPTDPEPSVAGAYFEIMNPDVGEC